MHTCATEHGPDEPVVLSNVCLNFWRKTNRKYGLQNTPDVISQVADDCVEPGDTLTAALV